MTKNKVFGFVAKYLCIAVIILTSLTFTNFKVMASDDCGETQDSIEQEVETLKVLQKIEEMTQELQKDIISEKFSSLECEPSIEVYKNTLIMAKKYNLNPDTLFATMYRESRFDPEAIHYNENGTVDSGICQINSVHSVWVAENGLDLWDISDNIEAACILISGFKEKYSEDDSLRAYAAGESGMLNGGGYESLDLLYDIISEIED